MRGCMTFLDSFIRVPSFRNTCTQEQVSPGLMLEGTTDQSTLVHVPCLAERSHVGRSGCTESASASGSYPKKQDPTDEELQLQQEATKYNQDLPLVS